MDYLPPAIKELALNPAFVELVYWMGVMCFGIAGAGLAFAFASRPVKDPAEKGNPSTTAGSGFVTRLGASLVHLLRWQPESGGRVERWVSWYALSGRELSVPLMWGLSACLGLAGMAIGSAFGPLASFILGGVFAGFYPLMIASRVSRLETEFVRGLPTTIILLMAEHRAGSSIEGALDRLSERPGAISRFISLTLAQSRQQADAIPLFSRSEQTGALAAQARVLALPELIHLVQTLEDVENQGQSANRVMERLNDMQVIELTKRGRDQIHTLSQRLVFVIALFFLAPIMGLLLYSLFTPVMGAF